MAVGKDVLREGGEGSRARAPRVDDGGDAGEHAGQVGIDAGPVHALEDVGVEIDEAGRDDLPANLHDARGLGGGDVGRDARDPSVLHGDVMEPVQVRGRIDDAATFEQEIEHGVVLIPWTHQAGKTSL